MRNMLLLGCAVALLAEETPGITVERRHTPQMTLETQLDEAGMLHTIRAIPDEEIEEELADATYGYWCAYAEVLLEKKNCDERRPCGYHHTAAQMLGTTVYTLKLWQDGSTVSRVARLLTDFIRAYKRSSENFERVVFSSGDVTRLVTGSEDYDTEPDKDTAFRYEVRTCRDRVERYYRAMEALQVHIGECMKQIPRFFQKSKSEGDLSNSYTELESIVVSIQNMYVPRWKDTRNVIRTWNLEKEEKRNRLATQELREGMEGYVLKVIGASCSTESGFRRDDIKRFIEFGSDKLGAGESELSVSEEVERLMSCRKSDAPIFMQSFTVSQLRKVFEAAGRFSLTRALPGNGYRSCEDEVLLRCACGSLSYTGSFAKVGGGEEPCGKGQYKIRIGGSEYCFAADFALVGDLLQINGGWLESGATRANLPATILSTRPFVFYENGDSFGCHYCGAMVGFVLGGDPRNMTKLWMWTGQGLFVGLVEIKSDISTEMNGSQFSSWGFSEGGALETFSPTGSGSFYLPDKCYVSEFDGTKTVGQLFNQLSATKAKVKEVG